MIGNAPTSLRVAETVDRSESAQPRRCDRPALQQHPAVMAAAFDVDVASTSIRVAEAADAVDRAAGQRQPQQAVGFHARHFQTTRPRSPACSRNRSTTAASQTRQAKEIAAQSLLVSIRSAIRPCTAAVGAWVANEGAKVAVSASEAEVRAATVALQGVQKEAAGGQRTTVDVLNSQQDLILAKARLIGAQRDRVIASYTLLSAIGLVDVKTLSPTICWMICPRCITIRCATHGTACACRRDSKRLYAGRSRLLLQWLHHRDVKALAGLAKAKPVIEPASPGVVEQHRQARLRARLQRLQRASSMTSVPMPRPRMTGSNAISTMRQQRSPVSKAKVFRPARQLRERSWRWHREYCAA